MNYILFGGSGFIGTHLIHLLLKECVRPGDVIYDLDLVMPGEEGVVPGIVEKNDGVQYIRLDVRKPIDFEFVPTPEDVIFDLAAVHRTPGHPEEAYFETNIRGAENVTAFAEKYGIRKILFTSSIAPYGASEDLKTEETLPTPNTPYGISKLVAEKIHQIWQARDPARELTIVRPGIVYGKGEHGNMTRLYRGQKKGYFFMPAGRTPSRRASMSRSWCASSSTGCWIILSPEQRSITVPTSRLIPLKKSAMQCRRRLACTAMCRWCPPDCCCLRRAFWDPSGAKGGHPSRPCPEADGIHQCLRQEAGRH